MFHRYVGIGGWGHIHPRRCFGFFGGMYLVDGRGGGRRDGLCVAAFVGYTDIFCSAVSTTLNPSRGIVPHGHRGPHAGGLWAA